MHCKKAQTAVELLGIYGWVVLIILIVLIMAYYSGYLSIVNMFPPYCNFSPTLSCSTFKFGYAPDGKTMALNYKLINGLGYDIWIDANAATATVENVGRLGRNNYTGYCYPNLTIVRQGDAISCTVMILGNDTIPTGNRKSEFTLTFTYSDCNAIPGYSTNHDCTGAPNHTVSGQIRAQLEPNVTKLYGCGGRVCDYILGENPTNCCADCPVSTLILKVPSSGSPFTEIDVNVTAKYADGSPASGATVKFTDTPNTGMFAPSTSEITNSTGEASVKYITNSIGDILINASTCGTSKTAIVHFAS